MSLTIDRNGMSTLMTLTRIGVGSGAGGGAEVDVRGHVLLSRAREHVGVRAMPVMAHQRSGRALRVVILVAREAVVDDEGGAFLQDLAQAAHPRLAGEADLALIGEGDLYFPRRVPQSAGRRALCPHQPAVPKRDTPFTSPP
jgi:hypothetical protein